jgi:hypothetical protein
MYDVHPHDVVYIDVPTSHPPRNIPFLYVTLILPSYVEARTKVLMNFQSSLDPSFEDANIDLKLQAFLNEFALDM